MTINLPFLIKRDVSIGYNGLELFEEKHIEGNQLGYSVTPDGESLVGVNDGDWRKEWIVIGRETCCGDPIFIDTSKSEFPVYTAVHGEGNWNPVLISNSYESLLQIIDQLEVLAADRKYPTQMESNPMTQKEYDEFLSHIATIDRLEDSLFWALMISDEEAGVGPEI